MKRDWEKHIQTVFISLLLFIAGDMYTDWKEMKREVQGLVQSDKFQNKEIERLTEKVFAVIPKNELLHRHSKK